VLPALVPSTMSRAAKLSWVLQAVLSVLADYVYVGVSHPIQGLDRVFASANIVRCLVVGLNCCQYSNVLYGAVAVGAHIVARHAKLHENWHLWIFCHGWWHILAPLVVSKMYCDELAASEPAISPSAAITRPKARASKTPPAKGRSGSRAARQSPSAKVRHRAVSGAGPSSPNRPKRLTHNPNEHAATVGTPPRRPPMPTKRGKSPAKKSSARSSPEKGKKNPSSPARGRSKTPTKKSGERGAAWEYE